MKILIIGLLIFFLFDNIAYSFDKWDNGNLSLASIFTAATIVDWGQTRDIVRNNIENKECGFRFNRNKEWEPACVYPYHETNIYLGGNPSMGKVDTYMPIAIISTLTIAHFLPKKSRKFFLYFVSILEINTIYNNRMAGLKINF